ncbi:hypothetical protein BWI96_11800 [Siphonobacter sp. SORGH_AS_0500]|uniref:hypothetical protein n=1 Tax=Siphonobacter sp. SORGH_AS_0500 TaxID=1864824 RepID=UPI000CB08F6E|nr:hypothetical protein [Siphonobacter sp. SORGH_AS_0500]PKK36531.1 hypothetical protein BWI96_11800 [Siphonobacter sp. SORGH_AS_0500]
MNRKLKEEALAAFLSGNLSRVKQIHEQHKPPVIVQADEDGSGNYANVSIRTTTGKATDRIVESHEQLTSEEFDRLVDKAKRKGRPSLLLFTDNRLKQ